MRAVVITQQDPSPLVAVEEIDPVVLEGDVLIDVAYSTINFKDAMVTQAGNRVARRSPLIGGVDLAGTVVEAPEGTLAEGTPVVVNGHDLGVNHAGGFASLARVPHSWVIPLPRGLSPRDAMIAGTAGFTSMASIMALEHHGLTPPDGTVLVTGASGGVGSFAVALLHGLGYEVTASSGKSAEHAYLNGLGAREVIGRDEIDDSPKRTLGSERWAGAVDCVGGATLGAILRSLNYGAAVAASGLTGGPQLATTVYPFIIRNVALLGIDAVQMPTAQRHATWERLANEMKSFSFESILDAEISLEEVPHYLDEVANSRVKGRILVNVKES